MEGRRNESLESHKRIDNSRAPDNYAFAATAGGSIISTRVIQDSPSSHYDDPRVN